MGVTVEKHPGTILVWLKVKAFLRRRFMQLGIAAGMGVGLKDPLIFGQCIHERYVAVLLNRDSYVDQYDRRIEARLDASKRCSELPRQCS